MSNNALWRINSDTLAAYTEDIDVMRKIKRSYSDFRETAQYYRGGEVIGRQYLLSSDRKRSARHLLGVNVQST